MLRSTPCGRTGFSLGSSPLATRSVQSAKYLNGTLPSAPASWLIICAPDCPDDTRRTHASVEFANSPNAFGIVRVDSWPS